MLRHVALVRTDVSEYLSASIIRVKRISELGSTLAVTSNRRTPRRNTKLVASYGYVPSSLILVTLMMEAWRSSKTSVLTRATQHNIPEDAILHSHLRENLKSYMCILRSKKCICINILQEDCFLLVCDVIVADNLLKCTKKFTGVDIIPQKTVVFTVTTMGT
jgi:hypothetical protein